MSWTKRFLVATLIVQAMLILHPAGTQPLPEKTDPFPTPLQQAPSLIEYLKQEEGFRSKPYKDSEGVLTIGYGLNLSEGITRAEAEWLLSSRLDHATYCLERRWEPYYRVSHETQDALADMAYQIGCAGLIGFQVMLDALDRGDCPRAKAAALDSAWHRETPERAERVVKGLCK